MKGDRIVIEGHHRKAAERISAVLLERIGNREGRFAISVAGESGSGKSEMAAALSEAFMKARVASAVLGQDDYFVLPPGSNDARRRKDDEWLGPHCEVRFDILQKNLDDALAGAQAIEKPVVDYDADAISTERMELGEAKVVIAEGTYVSLLKRIDARVFISRSRHETLEHRAKRNRGGEAGDPFIERILGIEHMIIAGHRQLADFVITRDYDVITVA
ncbi:MAG: hypothetical protein NT080_00495 [Spirochaetes bacterium]|nr:hypothetical protein [Spirochaetota bacterium]